VTQPAARIAVASGEFRSYMGFMADAPETRLVKCVKLGRELPGIKEPPLDNDLGRRVYDSVSQEAWRMWLEHSKMLINEFRLDLVSPQGQEFLMEQMEQFFFGEGAQLPPDYVPPRPGAK
jgi:Fe-S cluster biosynthesis and repair protein YggX